MSIIELESLLSDISPDAPSGEEDLMGDPEFIDLEIKVKGTPELEFDKKVVQEAAGPDWNKIRIAAVKLLTRTHDLRVAMVLTRALLHTHGLIGFGTGLSLIHGLVQRHWDSLYPQLDPEDGFDPMIRCTVLETMSFGNEILGPLKLHTLCKSASLGQFNYRDILIAEGKLKPLDGDEESRPKLVNIEAAFKDTDLEILLANQKAVADALQTLNRLEDELTEKIGDSGFGPDLSGLHKLLSEMNTFISRQTEERLPPKPSEEDDVDDDKPEPAQTEAAGSPTANSNFGPKKATPVNEINNRQDVIRLLDLICQYYQRYEPGSPVPLLLKRARQLVDKNFLEILQDLAPDSVEKINELIGATNGT